VEGTTVFIVDDMISTGGTMLRAATACRKRGAKAVHALATHGLFAEGTETLFRSDAVDRIIVTDSVAAPAHAQANHPSAHIEILPAGPLIGKAIACLHAGGSLSELLDIES